MTPPTTPAPPTTPDPTAGDLNTGGSNRTTNIQDDQGLWWSVTTDTDGNLINKFPLVGFKGTNGASKDAPGNATAANIPGLIFLDDGKGGGYYVHQDGTPATNAEVSAGATASRTSSSSSTSFNATPQRVTTTEMGPDGKNYTVIRDAVTGAEVSRAPSAYTPNSPEQQFSNDKALAAQGDAAAMARVQAQVAGTAANTATTEAGATSRLQLTNENQARLQAMGDTDANRRALLAEQQSNARAGLNAQVQGFQSVNTLAPQLGDLALKNAQFTKDTLSTPADYLARAFFTHGQTSPLPQVSQADVINQLTKNISDYQGALNGFQQNFGGFNAKMPTIADVNGTGYTPGAATSGFSTPPAAAPNPYATFNAIAQQQGAAGTNSTNFNAGGSATPGGIPLDGGPPRLAAGGFTHAPVMRVGDSPSGVPNATEETVVNPTGAPVGVIPNPATAVGGQRAAPAAPAAPKADPASAAIVKAIGFVSDTKTQHALVDELAKLKRGGMPRFADGTGAMGFSAPVLPTQAPTTQAALQSLEASVRPPAINSLVSGNAPGDIQLGFNVPSKMGYSALTPDDKSAFGTTLATQYNLAPSDVETAINQRYSTGNRGTAGATGF